MNTLDELAALSKAKPGTLSYSVLAIPMQITIENWKKKTGADIVMRAVARRQRHGDGAAHRHDAGRDRRAAEFHSAHPAAAR